MSGPTPAAVLVPLFIAGRGADGGRGAHDGQGTHDGRGGDNDERGEPHAVFTRRRTDLRRHAGEISFPGGRRDPEDADLAETALREAEEEIGLPRAQVHLLGQLPAVSTFVTGFQIHPFVGLIPAGLAWRVSEREVDAVLELPLGVLRESRTRTQITRREITFETEAYIVDDHLIWGATARILEHLFEHTCELLVRDNDM